MLFSCNKKQKPQRGCGRLKNCSTKDSGRILHDYPRWKVAIEEGEGTLFRSPINELTSPPPLNHLSIYGSRWREDGGERVEDGLLTKWENTHVNGLLSWWHHSLSPICYLPGLRSLYNAVQAVCRLETASVSFNVIPGCFLSKWKQSRLHLGWCCVPNTLTASYSTQWARVQANENKTLFKNSKKPEVNLHR